MFPIFIFIICWNQGIGLSLEDITFILMLIADGMVVLVDTAHKLHNTFDLLQSN